MGKMVFPVRPRSIHIARCSVCRLLPTLLRVSSHQWYHSVPRVWPVWARPDLYHSGNVNKRVFERTLPRVIVRHGKGSRKQKARNTKDKSKSKKVFLAVRRWEVLPFSFVSLLVLLILFIFCITRANSLLCTSEWDGGNSDVGKEIACRNAGRNVA